jgi:hypothetical protein
VCAKFISALTIIAISWLPEIIFARTEEIPAIDVTIQFRKWGDHVFRALEAAATEAGLTCNPSVKDYEQRKIKDEHGKVIIHPRQMQCGFGTSGSITAVINSYTSSGGIELLTYYELPRREGTSIVKPKIDALVGNVEAVLKADPVIESIDHTVYLNTRPVTSKVK